MSSPLLLRAGLLLACGALALGAVEFKHYIGYGGPDGQRIYSDVEPPTSFGQDDVAWQVELPSWGHGQPVVFEDKIYMLLELNEGEYNFPSLACFSLKDGSLLWRQELDQTKAVKGGGGEAARAAWEAIANDLGKRRDWAYKRDAASDKAQVEAAMAKEGYEWNDRWSRVIHSDKNALKKEMDIAKHAGFSLETWRQSLGSANTYVCIGQAYATPATDGELLYAHTAWGGIFCFDLEGKLIWQDFSPGEAGEYCRNGRSPILHGDYMISDITNLARCYDKKSGKLLWSGPAKHDAINTPAVITVDGVDIVYAAGNSAYVLETGERLEVSGWKDAGMQTLIHPTERNVVFFCGSGEHCGWSSKGNEGAEHWPPAAVRFTRSGQTLNGEVLWHNRLLDEEMKKSRGGNTPFMTVFDNKFYHPSGAIIDALTGKKVGQGVPSSSHLRLVANGHIYGFKSGWNNRKKEGSIALEIFTVDGKQVSKNALELPDDRSFSYGNAFSFGPKHIILRGHHYMICISK